MPAIGVTSPSIPAFGDPVSLRDVTQADTVAKAEPRKEEAMKTFLAVIAVVALAGVVDLLHHLGLDLFDMQ